MAVDSAIFRQKVPSQISDTDPSNLIICWFTHFNSAAGPVGPVFTGPLLALSYTICIRVSYSTGPLFSVGQVQPDHSISGGAGPV